jgi:hypothetical protein
MPRDGAIIFNDLIGKLDMLRECPECGLSSRYRLAELLCGMAGTRRCSPLTG